MVTFNAVYGLFIHVPLSLLWTSSCCWQGWDADPWQAGHLSGTCEALGVVTRAGKKSASS